MLSYLKLQIMRRINLMSENVFKNIGFEKLRTIFYILIISVLSSNNLSAQESKIKKPVDFSVYDSWNAISKEAISYDGNWVSYEINPYDGDGELVVMNPYKLIKKVYKRGNNAIFSAGSKFIAFKISAQQDSIRQLKLKKAKKDKFPKDSLAIWSFKDDNTFYISNLISFNLPLEQTDWIAYLHEFHEDKPDTTKADKKEVKKTSKRPKDAPEVFDLVVFQPEKKKEYRFKDVTEFDFSRNGKYLGFIQVVGDSIINSKVNLFNTNTELTTEIFNKEGIAKKITLDNSSSQAAFLFSADSTKEKIYNLFHWNEGEKASAEIKIDTNQFENHKDWIVSENGKIWFSRDDSKLYFGMAIKLEPEPKDTLLEEEKVKLDIWSWKDPLLQSQQLVELKKELKRTYQTVYHVKSKKVVQLENELVQDVSTLLNGNANVAFGVSEKPFMVEQSWQFPADKAYYIIDVNTGKRQNIIEKTRNETAISPFGKYVVWFDSKQKAWFSKDIQTLKIQNLTSNINTVFYDEEYDYPTDIPSYGYAGWTKDDEYFMVYDQFDIWMVDPKGKEAPVLLTAGEGRKNNIEFRYRKLNKETTYIEPNEKMMLTAFNKKTKQSGFYSVSWDKKSIPVKLIMGDFNFYPPIKAKHANQLVWNRSSVKEFGDVWYSDDKFGDPLKISYANPQQENYNWATVELVKWTTFDGKQEEGLLYKPENFDPKKKYPMLVYFYRLYSDRIHTHYYPRPSRSTINILFYTSNEYLVFIPNIRYEIGYPGKSAYNYIVSGTKAMVDKGFVDEKNIGIQGQSWGGYQAAFVITQTNMFKAASVGAPVSNMTSAYGGIRWDSGMSRMYQYEDTQSRIGATLWENPELYIKNSPLFYADKIETPLLIRHNDQDGAVPWYQGIELFVGLRRLNKPVWLLNYNGEQHNLRDKSPDCKDLSIRMFQFFNHYLKGQPAPVWLEKGIPAIEKGKTLGYELVK